ncbi:MAG: thiamine phosphate synthase [Halarcobacter sp.]
MRNRLDEALGFKLEASNLLYALCDFQTLIKKEILLDNFIELALKFDAKIIQYRDKVNSSETQIENLVYLKKKLNIPIIINDKIELINYADGLHLGQEDFFKIHSNKKLATKLIRKKIGNKLLGISTHNEFEILEANELDIDMIGLGAYKNTSTKNVPNLLGERISYLAKISSNPVCAIGGVEINDKIKNVSFNVVGSGLYN